jgi:hypothetical protein
MKARVVNTAPENVKMNTKSKLKTSMWEPAIKQANLPLDKNNLYDPMTEKKKNYTEIRRIDEVPENDHSNKNCWFIRSSITSPVVKKISLRRELLRINKNCSR